MRKLLSKFSLPAAAIYLLFIITGCNKNGSTSTGAPTLITTDVTINAKATTGQGGGMVTAINDSYLTAVGLCWSSVNKTPTIADSFSSDTIKTNSFTSAMTGLTPNTTYYARAYATNNGNLTGYGAVVTVSTGADLSTKVGTVSTFAGSGADGFADNLGVTASFSNPQSIVVDSQGNFYVADAFNSAIRKITPAGQVSTYTGNGSPGYVDGPVASARFYAISDLAIDAQNNIYVSDFGNNIIRKITAAGVVSTLAGTGTAGYVNGAGTVAKFISPRGLAVDGSGNVYVADQGNHVIRKITSAGVVSTYAGVNIAGYVDGESTACAFNRPTGLTYDITNSILYVAEPLNNAIRKISAGGTVTTFVGGPLKTTLVGSPVSLAKDATGNLYISDQSGRILKINTDKRLYTLAGAINVLGFANGAGAAAQFNGPQGLATDATGNVYVADYRNNRIRKIVQ